MSNKLFAEELERRDKVQIFADIIKVTPKPTKTTKILRLANIQYNIIHECLEKLTKAGLLKKILLRNKSSLREKQTKYAFEATEKGLKWRKRVEEIYQML